MHTEMRASEDEINRIARFLPMTGPYPDEDGDMSLPCIEVGGVQVYAYFKGGRLHVSVDVDTAHPEVLDDDHCLPYLFTVNGEVEASAGAPLPPR